MISIQFAFFNPFWKHLNKDLRGDDLDGLDAFSLASLAIPWLSSPLDIIFPGFTAKRLCGAGASGAHILAGKPFDTK